MKKILLVTTILVTTSPSALADMGAAYEKMLAEHREIMDGKAVVENKFTYAGFRMLGKN